MIKRLGACLLLSVFGVGCGVGDDVDPNNPNGLVCTDAFKLTGTFTPGTPGRDADSPTGCWPVGKWTFTATLDPTNDNIQDITGDQMPDRCGSVGDTKIATFDSQYEFEVIRTKDPTGDDWVDSYALTGAQEGGPKTAWNDKFLYKLKVTEGGGGECEGGLELYSKDGKSYWNLHPMQEGTTINGFGDFHLYKEKQY
jgi:hypothetical protein